MIYKFDYFINVIFFFGVSSDGVFMIVVGMNEYVYYFYLDRWVKSW